MFFAGTSFVGILAVSGMNAAVTPPQVAATLHLGESTIVNKTVDTPAIPPQVEVCLLEDETGSFADDIGNLKGGSTAADIYDGVRAVSPGARFAVAGFRDYPVPPHGGGGDYVYRLLSAMSGAKADWVNGVNALTAGGGADFPEAQYDAIVAAVAGPSHCGWSAGGTATRVLVVATDASFHAPGGGKPHVNDFAGTLNVLNNFGVRIIGLKAPGAGGELNGLAAGTGGTVQALSSDGSNIATAIIAGLGNLPITVHPNPIGCTGLTVTYAPPSDTVVSGSAAAFVETVLVVSPDVAGSVVSCSVDFNDEKGNFLGEQLIDIEVPIALDATPKVAVNELGIVFGHDVFGAVSSGLFPVPGAAVSLEITAGPNFGATDGAVSNAAGQVSFNYLGVQGPAGAGVDTIELCTRGVCDTVSKTWQDTIPPVAGCLPSVNPAGSTVPPAGDNGPGQNPDGFWQALGEDIVDPNPTIIIVDMGSGTEFGPFASGTHFKYVQAVGAPAKLKEGTGDVEWKIMGNGDAKVVVTDFAGNSSSAVCLVPPPPM